MINKDKFNLSIFDLRIDLSEVNRGNNILSPFEIINAITNKYFKYLESTINKTESKINRDKELKDIISKFYGLNTRIFSKEEIALLIGKSSEHVRQLIKQYSVFLQSIIQNKNASFKINSTDENTLKNFYSSLSTTKVISQQNFFNKLLPELGIKDLAIDTSLMLFFDVFKIKQRSPKSYHLRNNTFLFIDSNIKADTFFEICYLVFLYLEKTIIPIEIEDIIIDVKRKSPNLSNEVIKLACSELVEIQQLIKDNKIYYQIRLDYLSTVRDMVYRFLIERKEFTKLAEIKKEINHNLLLLRSKRRITSSVATTLALDNKFVSQGKTGFWGLNEWEANNESIYDLITNTLIHFNKPLKKKIIFDYIVKSRPTIPKRSFDTLIYEKSKFIKLKDGSFIINEWKEIYKDQIATLLKLNNYVKENKIQDQIKEQAIQLLQKNGASNLYLNSIVNSLNKKFTFSKASIYKTISTCDEFVKSEDENNKIWVTLNLTHNVKKISKTNTSVFVSYSWESQSYQEKVISFVDFLRKTGFNADLDISMMQNETSTDFNKLMHAGIKNYDKVIVLLSATYKIKAESFEGGVGKEYKYIVTNIDKEPQKFILTSFLPVTNSNMELIVPLDFIGREIVDIVKDEQNQFQYLFSKLTNLKQYNFSEVASETPIVEKKEIKPFTLGF